MNTMERLLKSIYGALDSLSCVYVDEYCRWYQLSVVMDLLELDSDDKDDICALYILELNNEDYISEEGINFILLNFDTVYKDDIDGYLTKDVMPDLKDYSMYMSTHLKDSMFKMSLCVDEEKACEEDKESVRDSSVQIFAYTRDEKRPLKRRHNNKWKDLKRIHENLKSDN